MYHSCTAKFVLWVWYLIAADVGGGVSSSIAPYDELTFFWDILIMRLYEMYRKVSSDMPVSFPLFNINTNISPAIENLILRGIKSFEDIEKFAVIFLQHS